jgi:hypothetical protein
MNNGFVELHEVLLYTHKALKVYAHDPVAENGAGDAKVK